MKKIVMFYGSDRAFETIIPSSYRKLSDVAMQMDAENEQIPLVLRLQVWEPLRSF